MSVETGTIATKLFLSASISVSGEFSSKFLKYPDSQWYSLPCGSVLFSNSSTHLPCVCRHIFIPLGFPLGLYHGWVASLLLFLVMGRDLWNELWKIF
jgi:hypothetical protein